MKIKHLYKYKKFDEFTKQIILDGIVYVPSPLQFNDPFDCRIPVIPDGTENDFKKILTDYFKNKVSPNLSESDLNQLADKILALGVHKNPLIMKEKLNDAIKILLQKTGVYSLSEKKDDILMWSHYADSHKGYCIEFENTSSKSFLNRARKVSYQKELSIINLFNESYLTQFLLTKSDRWSYEKEWRIINVMGPGLYELPKEIVSGIILGCQMSDNSKHQIIEWLRKKSKNIQLYQANINDRKFELDIIPISTN